MGVFLANTTLACAPDLRFFVKDSSLGGTETNFRNLAPKHRTSLFHRRRLDWNGNGYATDVSSTGRRCPLLSRLCGDLHIGGHR